MFKNNLNPPPKKSLSNFQTKCNNDNHDSATMNIISWIHDFPSQNLF